jgi:hypothetical protein
MKTLDLFSQGNAGGAKYSAPLAEMNYVFRVSQINLCLLFDN